MQDDFSVKNKSPVQTASPYLFVFMGASNLARGCSALAKCLVRCLAPNPVEILHAMGPGRGYCADGGIFNITYPAIGSSGILQAAGERAKRARKVIALITDIGNDIMYDVPVKDITSCLGALFQKLDAIGAEVFVHPIPLDFSKDVTKRQFRILRAIFYPHSSMDFQRTQESVAEVNGFLSDRAGGRIHLLPGAKDFLGVDKIHYSIFQSHKAWSQVAKEMLSVSPVRQTVAIGWLSAIESLVANMGRLVLCDMVTLRNKSPETF